MHLMDIINIYKENFMMLNGYLLIRKKNHNVILSLNLNFTLYP